MAPSKPSSTPAPTLISSVRRALVLLETVAEHGEITAKRLSREARPPLPTTYHLLRTLVHDGYLRREHGTFRLGPAGGERGAPGRRGVGGLPDDRARPRARPVPARAAATGGPARPSGPAAGGRTDPTHGPGRGGPPDPAGRGPAGGAGARTGGVPPRRGVRGGADHGGRGPLGGRLLAAGG
ncbi:hypothetical protein DEJ46_07295 [Streptomyces venezuelae]|uniref:HTH iclR-type domain-containing protein n=1 Tax=Streptomyces venezuelae TaxID=54571 RepID=A0A5P2AL31_STRVZ|nr:hypothetical protein DEJ46_07295 [Streptomyces venezuelae]